MLNRAVFIIGYPIWLFVITLVWFSAKMRLGGLEPTTFSACYDVFKEITGVK